MGGFSVFNHAALHLLAMILKNENRFRRQYRHSLRGVSMKKFASFSFAALFVCFTATAMPLQRNSVHADKKDIQKEEARIRKDEKRLKHDEKVLEQEEMKLKKDEAKKHKDTY